MKRILLSHSQIEAYNQCGKKFDYAHIQGLQSKRTGPGLSRGTTGHKFFEAFFKAIKDGKDTKTAQNEGFMKIASMDNSEEVIPLVVGWISEIWPTLNWEIIEVEKQYRIPISETLVFPLTIDLLIKDSYGQIAIVDHKFLYDPYSQELIDILPQLPKYAGSLRSQGIPVKYCIYNMIRTRNTSKEVYTVREFYPSNSRVKNSMIEQIEAMKEFESGGKKTVRTTNKMNCSHCEFLELCTADLNNEDTKYIREHSYEPNTYGYEDIVKETE